MHHSIGITDTQILEKCTIKMLLLQAKIKISSSKCFLNVTCEKIEQLTENINILENLLESFNIAYNKLSLHYFTEQLFWSPHLILVY